jgi:hypothetical protein
MLAADNSLSTTQLKSYLLANTTPVPALAGLSSSGGVLNAAAAVNAVAVLAAPTVSILSAPL